MLCKGGVLCEILRPTFDVCICTNAKHGIQCANCGQPRFIGRLYRRSTFINKNLSLERKRIVGEYNASWYNGVGC